MRPKSIALGLFAANVCMLTQAQSTAFTYQGWLRDAAVPANGIYDLRFSVFNAGSNGAPVGNALTNAATGVTNGLFVVQLDFGPGIFTGGARWLEIGVRTNDGGAFSVLNPRQALTATPYALFANTASNLTGVLPANQLGGTYANPVTFGNAAGNFSGAFAGNGAAVTNVNASTLGGIGSNGFWKTTGNAGTTPASNFIGTTDNQALMLKGSFVGVGRATQITSAEYFGVNAPGGPGSFGGMYVNTADAAGLPFYGYSQGGAVSAYHYVDGNDANKWKLWLNGIQLTVTRNGQVGVGTMNPTAALEVAGQVKLTGGAPGAGKLLMSDANGLATWQSPGTLSVFFGQNYSALFPEVVDNTAAIEIEGVTQGNVVVVNGPGLEIQRVPGFNRTNANDQPGPNLEFPLVFETDGVLTNALKQWHQEYLNNPGGSARAMTLLIKDLSAAIVGRWNLFEMQCTQIEAGTAGRQRFTLRHRLAPNAVMSYLREGLSPPGNRSQNSATDFYRVEIAGITQDVYPATQINYTNRTLALVFDYAEARSIYEWVRDTATGIPSKRALTLITENGNGVEISRRNFFGTFPLSFQYFTGFGQVEKLKEKLVLNFDYWQDG